MKLITKEIESKLPRLYSQESNPDPLVIFKLFDPTGSASWFITEGERHEDAGGDWLLFGYVTGMHEDELGYINLAELEAYRDRRFGLGIERDRSFRPVPLSEVKAGRSA